MLLLFDAPNVDGWLQDLVSALWHWLASGAGSALTSLLNGLGASTEPDFQLIVPAYNRMLAASALLAPALVAAALIERLLGGRKGAGFGVLLRVVGAGIGAYAGLELARRGSEVAGLLSLMWNADLVGAGGQLGAGLNQLGDQVLGTGGPVLVLAAILTLLLGILVYLELLLRSALILLTTVFIPLVCAFAIWPRFAGLATHLAEFLFALLLSKFVIVTAIYVGLLLASTAGGDHLTQALAGVAILGAAALSPALVMQGLRSAESSTSSLVRGWAASGTRAAGAAVGVAVGGPVGLAIASASGGGRAGSFASHLLANGQRGGDPQ